MPAEAATTGASAAGSPPRGELDDLLHVTRVEHCLSTASHSFSVAGRALIAATMRSTSRSVRRLIAAPLASATLNRVRLFSLSVPNQLSLRAKMANS